MRSSEVLLASEGAQIRASLDYYGLRRENVDAIDLCPVNAGDPIQLSAQIEIRCVLTTPLAFRLRADRLRTQVYSGSHRLHMLPQFEIAFADLLLIQVVQFDLL